MVVIVVVAIVVVVVLLFYSLLLLLLFRLFLEVVAACLRLVVVGCRWLVVGQWLSVAWSLYSALLFDSVVFGEFEVFPGLNRMLLFVFSVFCFERRLQEHCQITNLFWAGHGSEAQRQPHDAIKNV